MGGFNATHSFSYNMRDRDVIVKAEETAKKLGLSFSAYLIKCMKADLGIGDSQKKEVGCEGPNEENDTQGYIPNIEAERQELFNFIKSRTDTRELGKIQGNGKFLNDIAKRKINEIKVSAHVL